MQMDDEARRHFGNTLRLLRKQKSSEGKKVTQEVMAQLAGVSAGYIAVLEAGHRNPPKREKLTRLAQAYGTTPEELLRATSWHQKNSTDDGSATASQLAASDAKVSDVAAEVEWAFEAVVRDPNYAFLTKAQLPLPAKFHVVQIYELSRGRRLLTAEESAALTEMIAEHKMAAGSDHSAGGKQSTSGKQVVGDASSNDAAEQQDTAEQAATGRVADEAGADEPAADDHRFTTSSTHLLNLLKDYRDVDSIPKQQVVSAFLKAIYQDTEGPKRGSHARETR